MNSLGHLVAKYSNFRPTAFDNHIAIEGREDWLLVPVSQNRDSGPLDQSNFASAREMLEGESDTVEVHRFGHWGPGWFEILIVDPARADEVQAIADRLENYPILDDNDHSEREWEAIAEAWSNTSTRERIKVLARHDLSIFAARRDGIPQGLPYYDDFYEAS